jgi:hypothetical protein
MGLFEPKLGTVWREDSYRCQMSSIGGGKKEKGGKGG